MANKPSNTELYEAYEKAIAAGYSDSDLKNERAAAEMLINFLPDEWKGANEETARKWVNQASKNKVFGKEREKRGIPPKIKRKPQTFDTLLKSFIEKSEGKFPRKQDHSVFYDAIHASPEWVNRCLDEKKKQDYRCKLCNRDNQKLQGHILDYERWEEDGFVMMLCEYPCHPIADILMRFGKEEAEKFAEKHFAGTFFGNGKDPYKVKVI